MKQKNLIILTIVIVLLIIFAAFGGYYVGRTSVGNQGNTDLLPLEPNQRACTMEAKICPDGTAVGRTGPNCEFAPCPTAGR